MREQATLEVAWASSREGSNGCPGGEAETGSVVMESERTDSMGARNNHKEKGMETETEKQTKTERKRQIGTQINRQGERQRALQERKTEVERERGREVM